MGLGEGINKLSRGIKKEVKDFLEHEEEFNKTIKQTAQAKNSITRAFVENMNIPKDIKEQYPTGENILANPPTTTFVAYDGDPSENRVTVLGPTQIIEGYYKRQEKINTTISELEKQGVTSEHIKNFLNPPSTLFDNLESESDENTQEFSQRLQQRLTAHMKFFLEYNGETVPKEPTTISEKLIAVLTKKLDKIWPSEQEPIVKNDDTIMRLKYALIKQYEEFLEYRKENQGLLERNLEASSFEQKNKSIQEEFKEKTGNNYTRWTRFIKSYAWKPTVAKLKNVIKSVYNKKK